MSLYLIIMGVQGAGKGTQAAFIEREFGIPHVSTGDLMRAMKSREDELAKRVQQIMASGQLVDDDTTNEILEERLAQPDAANGVILDGYPRNTDQAKWLEKHLESKGAKLNAVLLLELDYYTAFKRAFGRVKTKDGQFKNIYFNDGDIDINLVEHPEHDFPPRIDATLKSTGEKLERRRDDHAYSVVKRIDIFEKDTRPLIEYYRDHGLLVEIDALQSIDAVSQQIKEAIKQVK